MSTAILWQCAADECTWSNPSCGNFLHSGTWARLLGGCHPYSAADSHVRDWRRRHFALPHWSGGKISHFSLVFVCKVVSEWAGMSSCHHPVIGPSLASGSKAIVVPGGSMLVSITFSLIKWRKWQQNTLMLAFCGTPSDVDLQILHDDILFVH